MYARPTVNATHLTGPRHPGEVQITNSTRRLVEQAFVCKSRGQIAVKGEGSMETWTLTGRR